MGILIVIPHTSTADPAMQVPADVGRPTLCLLIEVELFLAACNGVTVACFVFFYFFGKYIRNIHLFKCNNTAES